VDSSGKACFSAGQAAPEGEQLSRLKFAGRGRIDMLHKMSQLVSILLAVVILVLPLSACLTPAAKMSLEERECCQKMAGHCETSVMPSSHSCCQHPVSHQAVIASKIQRNDFGPAVAALMVAAPPMPRIITRSSANSFDSPPVSPPQTVTVLRI